MLRPRTFWIAALGFALAVGCEPAGRYSPKPGTTAATASSVSTPLREKDKEPTPPVKPAPLPPSIAWMPPDPALLEPDPPIVFVHESNAKEWNQLKQFWTEVSLPPTPAHPVGFLGLSPLTIAAVSAASKPRSEVRIKVPLGLDDPASAIPRSNPPTLGKWQLGKDLFFDEGLLLPATMGKTSCAGCHQPVSGFSGLPTPLARGGDSTQSLFNCVFDRYLFWDGRANALEEVVQRTLEDEREPAEPAREFHHSWSGVVGRLRASKTYNDRFRKVFGTPPTQDSVGKALATYLRTILCGDSIQDRAEQAMRQRKGKALEAKDYEPLLDDVTLKRWERKPGEMAEVAKVLLLGSTTFQGKGRCVKCHSGRNYSDGGFHNVGIGLGEGRFASLPIGLKDPRWLGAFKTPTLRGLERGRFFFHDGSRNQLIEALAAHTQKFIMNSHLDPELRDDKDPTRRRDFGLTPEEMLALMHFLKALDGGPIDPALLPAKR